jgi:hypothetical protein
LEEAVRKVEAEAAQRARDAARPPGAPPRAGDALRRASARPGEAPPAGVPTAAAPRPRPATPPPPGARNGVAEERADNQPRPPRNLRADVASPSPQQAPQQSGSAQPSSPLAAQPVAMQEPQLAPGRERPGGPPRRGPEGGAPQTQGVRGFRDITADADELGRAAAQANRAARKTYANVPSPSAEFERLEPGLDHRGGEADTPFSFDESIAEAERYAPQPPAPRPRAGPDRAAAKPVRLAAFPIKSAIAISVVLVLIGAAMLLWVKYGGAPISGLFKSQQEAAV